MSKKNYYVSSIDLESDWSHWLDYASSDNPIRSGLAMICWRRLLSNIYKMCEGIATNFRPIDRNEHEELAHEAFVLTIAKMKDGRLRFLKGKAPVFNLLTTTIIRHMFSLKSRHTRHNRLLRTTYTDKVSARLPQLQS